MQLENLQEEVGRLNNLLQRLSEVREESAADLPEWFAELESGLESVQKPKGVSSDDVCCSADYSEKFLSRYGSIWWLVLQERSDLSPKSRRVQRMLRKTLKEVKKFQQRGGDVPGSDHLRLELQQANFNVLRRINHLS